MNRRPFYTFILLSFLSLFLPAFFALADEPAPATALPQFVKARLDHVGPNRIGDDHWLDPAHSTTKDSTHTLTGSISGYIRLWDSATAALAWESRPSKTAITGLTFIDKTSAAATSGQDLIVFNLADGKELYRLPIPPCSAPCKTSVHFAHGHLFTLSQSSDPTTFHLWSLADKKVLHTFTASDTFTTLSDFRITNNTLITISEYKDKSEEALYVTSSESKNILRFFSLSDGHTIHSIDIPHNLENNAYTDLDDESYPRFYPNIPIFTPDNTFAAWLSQPYDASEASLSLIALSDPTKISTLPTPGVNIHYEYSEPSILFSPDQKTVAVTDDGGDLFVFFADISDGTLKNLRQHTTLAEPENIDDDLAIDITSQSFSPDSTLFYLSFDYLNVYALGIRGAPDPEVIKSDSLTLTVATAKPSKKKPPKTPTPPDEKTPPRIPPAQFTESYLEITIENPSVSPDGSAFNGLIVNGVKHVWPIQRAPFALTPPNASEVFYRFHSDGQLYEFASAVLGGPDDSCDKDPHPGSISTWDLKTGTRKVLYTEPQLKIYSAAILSNGQILIDLRQYTDDSTECDLYEDEQPEYTPYLKRFNPADNTLSPTTTDAEPVSNSALFSSSLPLPAADEKVLSSLAKFNGELSPNGQYIISNNDASGATSITLYDANTQSSILSTGLNNLYSATFRFSPDSKHLAVLPNASDNPLQVHIFDIESKSPIPPFNLPSAKFVLFSPDSPSLIVAHNADILIIDFKSQKTLKTLPGHTKPINSLTLSADGKTLFSSQEDGITIAWDWPAIAASLTQK